MNKNRVEAERCLRCVWVNKTSTTGVVDAYPSVTFVSGLNWWSCMTFIKVRPGPQPPISFLVSSKLHHPMFVFEHAESIPVISSVMRLVQHQIIPGQILQFPRLFEYYKHVMPFRLQTWDYDPKWLCSPCIDVWLLYVFVCLYCGCCISIALPRNSIGCLNHHLLVGSYPHVSYSYSCDTNHEMLNHKALFVQRTRLLQPIMDKL